MKEYLKPYKHVQQRVVLLPSETGYDQLTQLLLPSTESLAGQQLTVYLSHEQP